MHRSVRMLRDSAFLLVLLLACAVAPGGAHAGQLSLTWSDNSAGQASVSIERGPATAGPFVEIAELPPGVTAHTDTDLAEGSPYCYRLRAFDEDEYSEYSAVACATPPASAGLAVLKVGAGHGRVASAPTGLACGKICSASYPAGTAVTLTATAAAGSAFVGWTGGGCSGNGSCSLSASASTVVTAVFEPAFVLSVSKSGAGSGKVKSAPAGIKCGAACSAAFPSSSVVTLTAISAVGSVFVGWSGGCSGTGACTVDMAAARSVTATFARPPVALTVRKAGTGQGKVISASAGIKCGQVCAAVFPGGSVVSLSAKPAAGSVFTGWSGGGCAGKGSCAVTLGAATAVTARFDR